jgi:hypothetical protein
MHRIVFLLISIGLAPPLVQADSVDMARTSVSDWVQVEQTISRESIDWQADRSLIVDLIAIAGRRVEHLQKQVDQQVSFNSLAKEERRKLIEQGTQIDGYSQAIEDFLAKVENQLRTLQPQLPEPLAVEMAASIKRLPDADTALNISLSERMQTVSMLLTQIREFDNKVSIHQTIRSFSNAEDEVAVRTIWVGLGQAYYLAPNDAGYGLPSSEGWTWHSAPELSNAIRDSIRQLEGTSNTPRLIDLPIQITGGTL